MEIIERYSFSPSGINYVEQSAYGSILVLYVRSINEVTAPNMIPLCGLDWLYFNRKI